MDLALHRSLYAFNNIAIDLLKPSDSLVNILYT